MLYLLIAGCEIAFWVVLCAALLVRYPLRRPRAGAALLLGLPVIDLLLFVASLVDLARGAAPTEAHALAAVYIAVSLAFGTTMVRWADIRFAARFGTPEEAAAAAVRRPPKSGPAHAAHERRMWLRHLLAWCIGAALVAVDTAVIGDVHRAQPLLQWMGAWGVVLGIDFLWSFSYTVFPRRPKPDSRSGVMISSTNHRTTSGG
ncbi:hypothetical protein [Streptacidiphilus jiangxiensis]|uniref:Membrane protein YmcC n=1 Tax=Streptacidiphilus jiangxiensis TaxID=235985 RepID=A0A1H7U5F6_STRJI|nr:hypothetical protein [Streptacidiphilus jiangxiensis]SEL91918.1 hypothetical protein SAMN05414137_11575 [Streptacidiphilus jiangxiensis]